jgi:DNA-binding NarL/FixJ family response regulator
LDPAHARVIIGCMDSPDSTAVRCILILKADRIYAEALKQYTLHVFPRARVLLACSIEAAHAILKSESIDIFVTGVGASMDSDVLDLLAKRSTGGIRARRVLVVTVRREYRVLAALRGISVDGVFDSAAERPSEYVNALRAIAKGGRYWSQSVLDHMHRVGSASTALFRLLTNFEQVVLSVIGDGCDNTVAARKLRLSPATVSTVRRELHRKLGVQHRGELIRLAAQHGFVRFTASGIVRPGFGIMCAAYHARRARRADSNSRGPGLANALPC